MFKRRLLKKNYKIATILTFAIIPLSGLVTDVYIPSMPSMAAEMHVSSAAVQLTLSIFLLTYGLSQLFIGSLVDSFGRYPFVLCALALMAVTSLLIANTNNINFIYVLRVVQGLAVAASVVGKRAIFIDLYKGEKLRSYLSSITIIWSLGPIVAPFLGGYLQKYFGWHANFYFLALYAGATLVLEIIYGGETIQQRSEFKLKSITRIYKNMVLNRVFGLGLVVLALSYSIIIMYNMSGPFIIEHSFKLSPVIAGYASLALGCAWLCGGLLGKLTVRKNFYKKLLAGIICQLILVAAMYLFSSYTTGLVSLIVFAFLIHLTAGFIYNSYFTFCLSMFPQNAGIAGGLTGGGSYVLLSCITSVLVGLIQITGQSSLAISYAVLALLAAPIIFYISRRANA